MPTKESYHHGDLKAALIAGAIDLITQENVDSLSLRRLARHVGVSHAAPYRHFADKDDLLTAIADEGFRSLTGTLSRAQTAIAMDSQQQLIATGEAYIQWGISHAAHYRVMFGAVRQKPESPCPPLSTAQTAFGVLLQAVKIGQARGVIASGDARPIADAAWALVHGFVMLFIDGQLAIAQAETITTLGLQAFAHGLNPTATVTSACHNEAHQAET